jgi:hypothetical protein
MQYDELISLYSTFMELEANVFKLINKLKIIYKIVIVDLVFQWRETKIIYQN